ncbi:MAG: hypothetical protein ACLPWS_18685 [Rhodomicrobium sp.]
MAIASDAQQGLRPDAMALWTITQDQNHDVYTVVYLLKDALRSALSDAWFFERTALPKADVKGAGHAEIAAKLGRFRDSCKSFQEREALMLTKLLRARNWAAELRKLTPEFQLDIDQFLDATEPCEEMPSEFVRDAQRMFHGGASLLRFLSQRKPEAGAASQESQPAADGHYLVGGRKALYELRAACEVFLGQIDEEFFSAAPEDISPEPLALTFLDIAEEPLLLAEPLS